MSIYHQPAKKGAAGQALLEYVLLTALIIIVLLASVYRFNSAFAKYANDWFVGENSYLACLISEGLLPGDSSGACEAPHFNINDGKKKQLTGTTPSAPVPQPPTTPTKNQNPVGKNPQSSADGTAKASSRAKEGGGGSTVPMSRADIGRANSVSPGDAGGSGQDSAGYKGSSKVSSTTGSLGGSNRSGSENSRLVPAGRDADRVKMGRDDKIPTNERDQKTGREIAAEKLKKKKADQDLETGFSFGKIFKYMLIAVLIFGIFFFVGSQIVAVTRGNKR